MGILDEKFDDFNRRYYQPQIEGSKTGLELPGIVDQVITLAEGYHIEVTNNHISKVESDFIHRQTAVGAIRYSTPQLAELEQKLNQSASHALALELSLFEDLVKEVMSQVDPVLKTARVLAIADVASSLAHLAKIQNDCRPQLDSSQDFDVRGGRHPVVEQALNALNATDFCANDCLMESPSRQWVLTGPNMAGKSTFLRQNALIVVLAQIGSYCELSEIYVVELSISG